MSPFDKSVREVLRYLFHEYQKAPTVVYMVNQIILRHGGNPVEVTDYLLKQQWIRERWLYPDGGVSCRITLHGIEEIDAEWVRSKLKELVGGIAAAGGSLPLMAILQHKISEYAIALDVVNQLEVLGLVRTHSVAGNIIVDLTEPGKKYADKSSRSFFSVMSVA